MTFSARERAIKHSNLPVLSSFNSESDYRRAVFCWIALGDRLRKPPCSLVTTSLWRKVLIYLKTVRQTPRELRRRHPSWTYTPHTASDPIPAVAEFCQTPFCVCGVGADRLSWGRARWWDPIQAARSGLKEKLIPEVLLGNMLEYNHRSYDGNW